MLLPFSINSTAFATAFHALFTTSFLSIIWLVHQTVQDIALLFNMFLLLAKSVLPSCQQDLFLYIIFIWKNIMQMTHIFIYLSVCFEISLFYEITWTKHQKVLIFLRLKKQLIWNVSYIGKLYYPIRLQNRIKVKI